jgi:iron complex transport system substrate-binding protein
VGQLEMNRRISNNEPQKAEVQSQCSSWNPPGLIWRAVLICRKMQKSWPILRQTLRDSTFLVRYSAVRIDEVIPACASNRSCIELRAWLKPMFCLFTMMILMTGCRKDVPVPAGGMRVVSLAPNITEIVCAVGGGELLVGRTSACNFPPEVVRKVPVIGDFGVPSMEMMLSRKPTLVLDVALEDESVGRKIDQIGLKRERINCKTMADVPAAILRVGALLDRRAQAETIASNMVAQIAELRRNLPATNRPTVFAEIWSEPVITAGKGAFVSEMIELAGGRNLGDELDTEYPQVSSEWVIGKNPDVVLCLGMANDKSCADLVAKRTGWSAINAVKNKRVYDRFNTEVITRPGPRVLEGVNELKSRIMGRR